MSATRGKPWLERDRLISVLLSLIGNVFFPRLAHRMRWRYRLGPRGTLTYALSWAAFAVLFVWTSIKLARRQQEMFAEVREHLGREPTPDEVAEQFIAKTA